MNSNIINKINSVNFNEKQNFLKNNLSLNSLRKNSNNTLNTLNTFNTFKTPNTIISQQDKEHFNSFNNNQTTNTNMNNVQISNANINNDNRFNQNLYAKKSKHSFLENCEIFSYSIVNIFKRILTDPEFKDILKHNEKNNMIKDEYSNLEPTKIISNQNKIINNDNFKDQNLRCVVHTFTANTSTVFFFFNVLKLNSGKTTHTYVIFSKNWQWYCRLIAHLKHIIQSVF